MKPLLRVCTLSVNLAKTCFKRGCREFKSYFKNQRDKTTWLIFTRERKISSLDKQKNSASCVHKKVCEVIKKKVWFVCEGSALFLHYLSVLMSYDQELSILRTGLGKLKPGN